MDKVFLDFPAVYAAQRASLPSFTGTEASIFDVEHPHLSITSTGDQRLIVRVRCKFDAKDVGCVAGREDGAQGEGFGCGIGIVRPNIEIGVVGARCKELSGSRPAELGKKNAFLNL
jgi:hypothetical protein